MAVIVHRIMALATDDKDARSSFDDIVSDGLKLVDSHDSFDLWKEPLEEAEIPTGDSLDRRHRLCVGEVVHVESCTQAFPLPVENEEELVTAE